MNRKRVYLYLGFAVYQLGAFIFTVLIDGYMDMWALLRLSKYIPWFKYISLLGLILLTVDIVWFWMDKRANRRTQSDLEKENNVLKAKIYDFQEGARTPSTKV